MKMLIYILIGLNFPVSASAQLRNLDFEFCDTSTESRLEGFNCRYLEGWTRTNGSPFSEGYSFHNENGGVPDAQNGEMALRLSVWYTYDKDMAYQRAPYTLLPGFLKGYYTYTDNTIANMLLQTMEPDTATVTVLLSKWNSFSNQRDTIGLGRLHLNAASGYTAFSCPVHYFSTAAPDSILILLNCSRIREQQGLQGNLFGNNSYLTIDNLSLEENTLGLEDPVEIGEWRIVPNPGNGIIHIPGFIGDVVISDMNGKLLDAQSYPGSEIDMRLLPQGVYFLRLREKSGQVSYVKYVKQ